MVIFGKKPCVYTLPPFFFGPLKVDLLDATVKVIFRVFPKKSRLWAEAKKSVFFFTFFIFDQKNHKIYNFPANIADFLVIFWTLNFGSVWSIRASKYENLNLNNLKYIFKFKIDNSIE